MRLVKLHYRTVAIANQVSSNSLWKDGRPYLCIPMRKNANVFHIIPFRTSKRRPNQYLVNTVYFSLKRNLGQNQDGEYPYLDFSKSFLVRQNHFSDIPAEWHIEGYMRAAESLGKLHSMSLKYITKMNSGKLDGVKKTLCVDYAAILQALDEQMPLTAPVIKKESQKTKKSKEAVRQEKVQIYDEIDAELVVSTQESADSIAREGAISAVSTSVLSSIVVKTVGNSGTYGTTMTEIRAEENEIDRWNKWLESDSWQVDFVQQERDDVYAGVKVDDAAPQASNKDILKEMHEEVYSETVFKGNKEEDDF